MFFLLLKISQISQKNNCVSLKSVNLLKGNFIRKETPTQVFSWEFFEVFKEKVFVEH